MRILVTAGNTQAPIDRVRCLTNIFSGRTGTRIALVARQQGHTVGLLTSHPEVVRELAPPAELIAQHWYVARYRTFEELQAMLAEQLTSGLYDAVLMTAAISDHLPGGVYAPGGGTQFDAASGAWSPNARLED